MPFLLRNALLSFLLLPSSAPRIAADATTSPAPIRSRENRRRAAQTTMNSTNASITPLPPDHDEWYLPDVKLNLGRTWLFGGGDLSEIIDFERNSTVRTGDGRDAPVPAQIDVPALLVGEHVVGASAGGLHAALVTNEGRVLTAGRKGEGRGLGRDAGNGTAPGFVPVVEVHPLLGGNHSKVAVGRSSLPRFVKVVASQYFTFAIDDRGNAWSTGSNAYAQLCLNDTASRDRFHQVRIPPDDDDEGEDNIFDGNAGGREIVDVALGYRHAILLRRDGRAYGCGWNQYGQLGVGPSGGNAPSPAEIAIDVPDGATGDGGGDGSTDGDGRRMGRAVITDVVAGRGSSYFLTSSKHVYATGTNYKGQLCLGHREDRTLPTMLAHVEGFLRSGGTDFSFSDEGVSVESIAAGSSSLYLLLSNGLLLACGENTHGQLGIGGGGGDAPADDARDVPASVAADVAAVSSGPLSLGAHLVAASGGVYAVGFDGSGERGNRDAPVRVACGGEGTTILGGDDVTISCGDDVTLYLATEGAAFGCGDDDDRPSAPPTSTPSMTASRDPSAGPSSSGRPSPPTTIAPSLLPSASASPTSSPAPSSETEVPTTEGPTTGDGTDLPTPFVMMSPVAASTDAPAGAPNPNPAPPPVVSRVPAKSAARDGLSNRGSVLPHLLGASLVVLWQWL